MPSVDTLTRSGGVERDARECWSDPLALPHNWLLRDRITILSDLGAEQISRAEPRYSAERHHIFNITARPRLLSVTESLMLPPQPKAVNMSNIDKFSIREWLVPPILLPIFLVLLVAAATFIQW